MTIYKLTIQTQDRCLANYYAGLMGEVVVPPADAVSIFDHSTQWLIEGYFTEKKSAETAAEELCTINSETLTDWTIEEVGNRNWVALSQAALPPVYTGRFTIYGSHDRIKIGRGLNRILIDAGEAFGTAHHATTYSCLMAIDQLTRRRSFKNILDLGTGSGILALALRRALPQANILATDMDQRSVEVAQENAQLNGDLSIMHGRLNFITARGLRHKTIRTAQPFDLIVANILARPLLTMASEISAALHINSTLLLSGILTEQAASIIASYTSHGLRLDRHMQVDGWSTLVMIKRS